MNISNRILSILTISVLGLAPVAIQAQSSDKAKAKSDKVVVTKASELSAAFTAAKTAFAKGDNAAAAKSIRSGEKLIGAQVEAGKPEFTQQIAKSALELHALAINVEKGVIKKESTLDNHFASAHNSLASYFSGRADRELAAGNKKGAGAAMAAVANNIEGGAKWAGHTLTDAGKKSVGLLRKTSGTLVSGAGTGVEMAGGVLKGGLGVITKIGSKIKGDKAMSDKKVTDKTKAATGGVVETTGKTAEKAGDVVKKGGGVIKKAGDAIKGKGKEEAKKDAE